MPADYHTHTPLCRHAEGNPADLAAAAVAAGLTEIGFSDHNPMPAPFDDWRMLREELPRYFDLVNEARTAFPELTIRLALECDFIPGHEGWIEELTAMAPWDYLIGSVHYLEPGWAIDNPALADRFDEANTEAIWTRYTALQEQAIRTGLFDFIGHPDLAKRFGHRPKGDLRRFYEPVIQALADTGTAFEINTAGKRKTVGEIYPAPEFLTLARRAGVPLCINSDAHRSGEVGADFDEARQLALTAGYNSVVLFHQRKRTSEPL